MGSSDDPGWLLGEQRRRAGLSQRELAERAGVSVRGLRDIEQGRVLRPREASVRRLLGALSLAEPDRAVLLDRLGVGRGFEAAGAGGGVHVGVLGPLIVRRGDVPLSVLRAMPRTLLCLLALQPGEVVSIAAAVDVLWGDQPPSTCHNLIQVYVGQLRRLLDPGRPARATGQSIRHVPAGYLLDPAAVSVDVMRFDALFDQAVRAQAAGAADAVTRYRDALCCWRGPVLGDGDLRLRHHPAVVRLAGRRVEAAMVFADLALAAGWPAETLEELRGLCTAEPLHEGLHCRLIRVLAAVGEQAAALRVFSDLRDRLVEQLGVSPGPEVVAAYLHVLRVPAPSGESASISAASTPATAPWPAQLPAGVSAFTGREVPLLELSRMHDGAGGGLPIVVVTGPGGVGKTALVVQWAYRVRSGFPDGQLYVNLLGYAPGAPVRPVAVLARFLHALGVPAEQIPAQVEQATDTFRSLMSGRRMLIILDNARHADQVRPLLPGSPGSMVIVTSRNRLRGLVAVEGARLLTLDVLDPAEAHALLCQILGDDRVKAETDAVDILIQACGGFPLALRIAAANLAGQPQLAIADYAGRLISRPLATLRIDGDDHTAVRAAFDLSYAALPAGTRKMFRLLGLVPGPDVTAAGAAALAGIVPDQARQLLDALADAHLADQNAPDRYTMHDLIRVYAQERVGEEDSQPDRESHTRRLYEHYLYTVDTAARLLYPGGVRLPMPPDDCAATRIVFATRAQALVWLDQERHNLVAAVAQAAKHGPREVAWLLCDALRAYFGLRMYTAEWESVARAGLAAAEADNNVRARVVCQLSLARLYSRRGMQQRAIEHYTRVLALARQTGWLAAESVTLDALGNAYRMLGQLDQAATHFIHAHTVSQQAADPQAQATTRGNLALVYLQLGQLQQAKTLLLETLQLFRQITAPIGEAACMANLGEIHHQLGALDQALEFLTGALHLQQEIGDRRNEADTRRILAEVHRDAGRLDRALEQAQTSQTLAQNMGDRRLEAQARTASASITAILGNHESTIRENQHALDLATDAGDPQSQARALIGLARARQNLGHHETALTHAHHALTIAQHSHQHRLQDQARTTITEIQHTQNT